MRLTEFHRNVLAEFGDVQGPWLVGSHVLTGFGVTAAEAIEAGADLREVWWALCRDNDVPPERWLGPDEAG
ncbi:hypothetical protein CSPHI_05615 [Corynebacterium sphenisci DSM 44792]|uniref:Signal transduction histidine kinase n=1 Tax=Corynebacterium sphenisci DSM 44792 TaxID=1437874 RepID=A0A1L7CXS4_9CORY|nr:DUF3046 domain-containing protein [Corynebacterium sphenisci]APT90602.1 hypothetical protein CSPHI_05615 [Corynebacterium sphenisci DSM 44792]